jgi:FkbM family methyltransferase
MDISYQIRKRPLLGRLILKAIPDMRWQINVRPIGKVSIRLRQHRMFWLRPPLVHEGFMLGGLQRLIREGEVAYDIGANIGLYSRFMVQVFKASHVYAFEPIVSNCTVLTENLKIAGCTGQVTIIPCAVGDQDGTCDFQVDCLTSNSGALDAVKHGEASASNRQYGLPATVVRVTTSRLDTLLRNGGIPKPDVIKLDVEGAEVIALEGAKHLLSQHHPRLVIELHGTEVAARVLNILWDLDYRCFGYLEVNGASTYKELTNADLGYLTELYSLHYLVASTRSEDLVQPIKEFGLI